MVPGIDPKVDIVFKRLFGSLANIDLLIDLLNAVLGLSLADRIVAVEILNPFNDREALDDKLSILDIKARDARGRQFDIEMQIRPYYAYAARVVYYLAKLHQQQLHAGEAYHKLAPSYSISFVNHELYPNESRWHWRFQLRDAEQPGVVFSDQLAVHVLELPKFRRAVSELASPLDRWCYFLRYGDTLDTDDLPGPLRVHPIPKAMEVMQMLTQDELEREKYEARLKFQRDAEAELYDAERRGEQHGKQRGRLIGRVQAYEQVLQRTPTSTDTLDTMPLEQLQQLADRLQAQLTGRG